MDNQEIVKELTEIIKTRKVKAIMNIGNLSAAVHMLKKAYDIYKNDSEAPVGKDIKNALTNLAVFMEGANLKLAANKIRHASQQIEV